MCIIVDVNVSGSVFNPNKRTDLGALVAEWVYSPAGSIATCEQMQEENTNRRIIEVFARLKRNNKLFEVDASLVDETVNKIRDKYRLTSNDKDHPMLALGYLSCAKVLFTNDGNLKKDFKRSGAVKNGKLISYCEGIDRLKTCKKVLKKTKCKK